MQDIGNERSSLRICFGFLFADIRRSLRPFVDDKTEDDFLQLDVSLAEHFDWFLLSFI